MYDKLVIKVNAIDSKIEILTKTQHDFWTNKVLRERLRMSTKRYLIRGPAKKTDYNTKIIEIENEIPSVTGLVTTTALNTKTIKIENKMPDVSSVAANAALNTKAAEVESKIPDVTNLALRAALNIKVGEIESKIPDTTENKVPGTTGFNATSVCNRLTKISFEVRMEKAAKGLARKIQVDNALDIADNNREKEIKTTSNV